jgi:hypothetical protein
MSRVDERWPDAEALMEIEPGSDEEADYERLALEDDPDAFDIGTSQDY